MKTLAPLFLAGVWLCATVGNAAAAEPVARLNELDAFWSEASRTVRTGDFAGYETTYHSDAVLVTPKTSTPIRQALTRWKPGFDNTKAGKITASVQFRFSKRLGDDTTAHETGVFLYSETDAAGKTKESYMHFDALLVKRGAWKMLMEHQKGEATLAEWAALATR